MQYYLLVCRSLTYAQRSARVLERAGIKSMIIRTTKDVTRDGCGYSLKIRSEILYSALSALQSAGLPPRNVLGLTYDGKTAEVTV